MFLSKATSIVSVPTPHICGFDAPVEQTDAAKVRQTETAFVHWVKMPTRPRDALSALTFCTMTIRPYARRQPLEASLPCPFECAFGSLDVRSVVIPAVNFV